MNSEEELFNKLRQKPIFVVDQAVLECFDMPGYIDPNERDTYEIELLNEADFVLLNVVLAVHHWELNDYLKNTVIAWNINRGQVQ